MDAHTVYLAHRNSKGDTRGNRFKNNEKVVRNLKEINVATMGKSPKQGLTSAKDVPMELPESPYHRLD